ncbi:hypothetical protein BC30075_2628 [Bacillus cereus]|nr:hypothetical protein BC30075_2628 [Bacillus cereus]
MNIVGVEKKRLIPDIEKYKGFFGFQELTRTDNDRLGQWLEEQVQSTHDTDYLKTKHTVSFVNGKLNLLLLGA